MYIYFHPIELLKVYLFAFVSLPCWSNRLALEKQLEGPNKDLARENRRPKKKTKDSRHTTVMRQDIKYNVIESRNIDPSRPSAMIYYCKQLLNAEGRPVFQNVARRSL